MKLLLDENLPHKLRLELPGHEVFTVTFMGWSGIENGELLAVAAEHAFDALLTMDRGIEFEQNTKVLPLAVIVISAQSNALEDIQPLLSSKITSGACIARAQVDAQTPGRGVVIGRTCSGNQPFFPILNPAALPP
jgi:hypothetical protein